MFTKSFWLQTLERAIKTAAQAALAILSVGGIGLLDVHWDAVGSVAGLAAICSVLTSIASSGVVGQGSPSLVPMGKPLATVAATSTGSVVISPMQSGASPTGAATPAPPSTDPRPATPTRPATPGVPAQPATTDRSAQSDADPGHKKADPGHKK